MCVLIYRAPNGETPDLDTLAAAWESNPDGAGYAYTIGGGLVRYSKGFMAWEDFERAYTAEAIPASAHLIIHFRFATHGGKSAGLTHPFPLAQDNVKKLDGVCLSVCAHNGILSYPARQGHSDTSSFVLEVLSEHKAYWGTGGNGMQFLLNTACADNKVIELTGYGPVFYGEPWKEYGEGLYFSNLSFLVIPSFFPVKRKGKRAAKKADLEAALTAPIYCYYCGAEIPWDIDDDRCPSCHGEPLLFQ